MFHTVSSIFNMPFCPFSYAMLPENDRSPHFLFCTVTLLNTPGTPIQLSWGRRGLSAQSGYLCQLTVYLMQQTLIATSERSFIRYCAALRILPSLAGSFREKTVQQRAVRTWWLHCNNNSSTARLTAEQPHLLCWAANAKSCYSESTRLEESPHSID